MEKRKVTVVGAGVVGLACGLSLQQAGFDVTMVDMGLPGEGASAGNPGAISLTSIAPAAVPGVIARVPGWLFDPHGPLVLRWRHLPAMLPWLAAFLRNATPERASAAMAALASLTQPARDAWQPLLEAADAVSLVSDRGHLVVYRSRAAHDEESAGWRKRAALGFAAHSVSGGELAALEPQLDPGFAMGRFVEGNAQVIDPLALSRALAQAILGRGGRIERDRVGDFLRDGDRVTGVQGECAAYAADLVVLAAGAHSAALARRAGERVLLQPERGYNMTVADAPFTLARPVFSPGDKVMAASVGAGLRLAGTAEFAGFHAPPDFARAEGLLALGRGMFPALRQDAQDASKRTPWSGYRPSTPDSLPVIGMASRVGGLIHAFGHGHVGLTTAGVTAAIVTALARGNPSPVPLDPFSPQRF